MFGINKNGTKHKIGIIMPSLFPASRTTYDPTTSGLSATRVQGAIDEVAIGSLSKVGLTYGTNVSVVGGGYTKRGNHVVVNIRLLASQSIAHYTSLVSGLPMPLNDGVGYVPAYACVIGSEEIRPCFVNASGEIVCNSSLPADTFFISANYYSRS